jgi:hypothetical protein
VTPFPGHPVVEATPGFDPVEIAGLTPLPLAARNMDTGGELRGRIKV